MPLTIFLSARETPYTVYEVGCSSVLKRFVSEPLQRKLVFCSYKVCSCVYFCVCVCFIETTSGRVVDLIFHTVSVLCYRRGNENIREHPERMLQAANRYRETVVRYFTKYIYSISLYCLSRVVSHVNPEAVVNR